MNLYTFGGARAAQRETTWLRLALLSAMVLTPLVALGAGQAATIPAPRPTWFAESNQAGANLGNSVASAGDVNGDGYADIIVGAPAYTQGESFEGRAYAYYGSATGVSRTPNWVVESNAFGAHFGVAVAGAGDVNGDGYDDVIVGAHLYSSGQANEGRAYVFYGSQQGLSQTPNWTYESNEDGATFGHSVAGAGDINGDGFADVIIGADNFSFDQSFEGRAYVFEGSAAGLHPVPDWTVDGNQEGAFLGNSVAGAGDVNGDGFGDVIVGAFSYTTSFEDAGRAYVYYGSASGLSQTPNWTAEGGQRTAYFGVSVDSAGDVNGDGFADVIIGASFYDNGQVDEGRAFVYHGSTSGLSLTPDWTVESNQSSAQFGSSVAGAGDINGDGYDDVVIGIPDYTVNSLFHEGRAQAYLGSASGLRLSPGFVTDSNQANANLGNAVAGTGDVTGTGRSGLLVGAFAFDHGQQSEGVALAYYR